MLNFPHPIAHCISADFKLGAGLAKQIKKTFSSFFWTKKEYKLQVLHAQYLGLDKFVFHLIVKPSYFHKSTYRSLRKTLLALRDELNFYRINKLGIPHLSCGLDKHDWTEVQKIIHETFRDSKFELTVFTLKTPIERTTSGDQTTAVDLQKAQTTDTGFNQVVTWVRKQSRPPRSNLQGLPRDVWKMWNLFDELTVRHGILCRKYENLKTDQVIFQQVVPPALVQKILHILHSDHTSAHLGVTKTLEKVRSRFYWPGYKRDVEVFVASCFVCQKRNSPTKKHIHSLRAWKPSFLFSTVGIDFLGPLPPPAGNQYILLIGDNFTKWHEVIALPDQSALTTAKALMDHWITRFGCPEGLHSDQGRNFEPKLFTSLTKPLQVDETRTTAFHPQSNAPIERTHRTLLNMMAETTDKNQRNWSELLPYVMLAYCTSVHESTGYTPFSYFSATKRPSQ